MDATPASLLERLQDPAPASADWQRLHDIYTPFIRGVLGRAGLPSADGDDLAQDVLLVLVKELPAFRRQREGSFRTWLRRITAHRLRTWYRSRNRGDSAAARFADHLDDPGSELSARWDRDHDRCVLDRLFAAVRPDFEEATWQAFQHFALDGLSAAATAAATGLTENAVMLAKSRILRRLRAEAGEILE